jgi:hypothetical protein
MSVNLEAFFCTGRTPVSKIAWKKSPATAIQIMILWAACLCSSAHAESIYKSTGRDGMITYSSRPVPDARESVELDVQTLSPEQRRATQLLRTQDKARSAQIDAELSARENEWRRVDREILSAQKELAHAESAQQKGREPLPGERRENVGGGSRLSEAYFQRLHQAELRVEQARQHLDQAYAARNALK